MSRGQASSGDIVDVHSTINAVARLIAPTAKAHSVDVQVNGCSPALLVRGDEAELQNALVNLMLNAIQACRPGGHVTVSTETAESVHIRVKDDGCGIRPDDVKRIFEPFFSMRKGGTGLGLFLTLNSVRRWRGDIRVESVPGEGSTFDITLPTFTAAASNGTAG
jgi:signal transduction histidine kinase